MNEGATTVVAGVPRWVRVGGLTAWLLLGIVAAAAVALWGLSYTSRLVTPLLFAAILAVVFAPVVEWMHAHRVPRGVGSGLVLLFLLAVAVVSTWAVLAGVIDQSGEIAAQLRASQASVHDWLRQVGVSPETSDSAVSSGSSASRSATTALLNGVFTGLAGLTGLIFMLFIGSVLFLFLVHNGAQYASWVSTRLALPPRLVLAIFADAAESIRGYARGTTVIAVTNAVPVGLAVWALDVPLVGTITLITFLTAYIPYLGAIIASVFACLVALGAQGLTTALILLLVILLVNNVLQNAFAPLAYGSSLHLDPLVILLVTTGAGLVGGIGLVVLAAPLTAIIVRSAHRFVEELAGPAPAKAADGTDPGSAGPPPAAEPGQP